MAPHRSVLIAVMALAAAASLMAQPQPARGVIRRYAQNRLTLELDGRGATRTFLVTSATHLPPDPLEAGARAEVHYTASPRGAVATDITILPRPHHTGGLAPGEDSWRPDPVPDQSARFLNFRLQANAEQAGPGLDRIHAGATFYAGFYYEVDSTRGPLHVRLQCSHGPRYILLPGCQGEDAVPAGFRGIRFRAFPVSLPAGGDTEQITATLDTTQRKTAEVAVVP